MHPQFCRPRPQKSSFAETVTTAALKITSVRFGRLACSPLGPHSILHSSTNNRSCCSSRRIVPCPTSHRGERQRSDGGRDTCKFSPSLPCLPAGPSIWHLTTIAVNRPLECHWHSFCLAQFFRRLGFVSLQPLDWMRFESHDAVRKLVPPAWC